MKRVTKITALMLMIVMVFTGCATAELTTKINNDGSAKMTEIVEIEKTAFDSTYKNLGYTNPEEILKMSAAEDPNMKYNLIKKDDGKEYYQIYTEENVSAGKLSETLTTYVGTGSDIYATKDTVYGVVDFSAGMAEEDMGAMAMMSYDPNSVYTIKYIVEFSAPVVSSTGVIATDNPNKVTFNLSMNKKTAIFATTDKNQTADKVKNTIKKLNQVKKPKIKSLKVKKITGKKGTVVLKLKKAKGIHYEITYSTKKKMTESNSKYKYTKKPTVTIKKLKAGKKYYFKVRTYKTNFAGREVYSKAVKKNIKIAK